MTERIIVSGASGVIGSELMRRLALEFPRGVELVCVLRSEDSAQRLATLLGLAITSRVRVVRCDLTDADGAAAAAAELPRVSHCLAVHAAADVSWHKSLQEIRPINVDGSVAFARLVRATAETARLIYISSAYTSREEWTYRNSYEQTKAEADRLLRRDFPDLHPSTFSCSLVVGDSVTGAIGAFHGLYPLMRVLSDARMPFLVARPDVLIDIVPLDWTVGALVGLVRQALRGVHVDDVVAAAGPSRLPFRTLVAEIRQSLDVLRRAEGRGPLPEIPIISFRRWEFLRRSFKVWNVKGLDVRALRLFERILESYRPYLEDDRIRPAEGLSGPAPDPRSYLPRVVEYWRTLDRDAPRRVSPAPPGLVAHVATVAVGPCAGRIRSPDSPVHASCQRWPPATPTADAPARDVVSAAEAPLPLSPGAAGTRPSANEIRQ